MLQWQGLQGFLLQKARPSRAEVIRGKVSLKWLKLKMWEIIIISSSSSAEISWWSADPLSWSSADTRAPDCCSQIGLLCVSGSFNLAPPNYHENHLENRENPAIAWPFLLFCHITLLGRISFWCCPPAGLCLGLFFFCLFDFTRYPKNENTQ